MDDKDKYTKDLKKIWQKWLIDVDCKEIDIAKENGIAQQNLNRKINQGTISVVDLLQILDKKGYTIKIIINKE